MKSTNITYFILLFGIYLSSCTGNDVVPCNEHPCTPCNTYTEVSIRYNELNEFYQNNCVTCLEGFFNEWAEKYPPKESIPDSAKWLYDLFEQFYVPQSSAEIFEIDDPNLAPNQYTGTKYYIVNDQIALVLGDTNSKALVLEDFRPKISSSSVIPLYARQEFTDAIACFLNNKLPFGEKHADISDEEREKRLEFLENFIKLTPRSWSVSAASGIEYIFGDPIIETQPLISEILVSVNLDSAIIDHQIGTWQFLSKYKKTDSSWELSESVMEWDGSYL